MPPLPGRCYLCFMNKHTVLWGLKEDNLAQTLNYRLTEPREHPTKKKALRC